MFTFGLVFGITIPNLAVVAILGLVVQYFIDKYNLMYIYPLEFESQAVSRKALIKNSFYAVIIFQVSMVLLGLTKNHVSKKLAFYLLGFIFI